MNPPELFELQLFDGKVYAPIMAGERCALEAPFEQAAGLRVPRRIVKVSKARPAKPRYSRPPPKGCQLQRASGCYFDTRERDESVIADYIAWAKSRGLASVAVYDAWPPLALILAEREGMKARPVPVSDLLGPAPAPEPDIEAGE